MNEFLYSCIKFYITRCKYLFYRTYLANGVKDLPTDGPIVLAPNHQNALVDPLNTIMLSSKKPYYVARADIFKKPLIIKILNFFRVLPIYRRHDGVENMSKNDEIFAFLTTILMKNGSVGIFPEGSYSDKFHLKVLKKGIARFAFSSAEACGYEKEIYIVPIGLNYSDVDAFQADFLANFGEPIRVSEFYEMHKTSPAKAVNMLMKTYRERLQEEMIDIQDLDHYDAIDGIRNIKRAKTQATIKDRSPDFWTSSFQKEKNWVREMETEAKENPATFDQKEKQYQRYTSLKSSLEMTDDVLANPYRSDSLLFTTFYQLFKFPVFLYGWIHSIIPWKLTQKIAYGVKDPQFISTAKFGGMSVLFPFFYLFFALIFLLITGEWLWTLIYLVTLPMSGMMAYRFRKDSQHLRKQWKWNKLVKQKNEDALELEELFETLS